eukprot:g2408.t1
MNNSLYNFANPWGHMNMMPMPMNMLHAGMHPGIMTPHPPHLQQQNPYGGFGATGSFYPQQTHMDMMQHQGGSGGAGGRAAAASGANANAGTSSGKANKAQTVPQSSSGVAAKNKKVEDGAAIAGDLQQAAAAMSTGKATAEQQVLMLNMMKKYVGEGGAASSANPPSSTPNTMRPQHASITFSDLNGLGSSASSNNTGRSGGGTATATAAGNSRNKNKGSGGAGSTGPGGAASTSFSANKNNGKKVPPPIDDILRKEAVHNLEKEDLRKQVEGQSQLLNTLVNPAFQPAFHSDLVTKRMRENAKFMANKATPQFLEQQRKERLKEEAKTLTSSGLVNASQFRSDRVDLANPIIQAAAREVAATGAMTKKQRKAAAKAAAKKVAEAAAAERFKLLDPSAGPRDPYAGMTKKQRKRARQLEQQKAVENGTAGAASATGANMVGLGAGASNSSELSRKGVLAMNMPLPEDLPFIEPNWNPQAIKDNSLSGLKKAAKQEQAKQTMNQQQEQNPSQALVGNASDYCLVHQNKPWLTGRGEFPGFLKLGQPAAWDSLEKLPAPRGVRPEAKFGVWHEAAARVRLSVLDDLKEFRRTYPHALPWEDIDKDVSNAAMVHEDDERRLVELKYATRFRRDAAAKKDELVGGINIGGHVVRGGGGEQVLGGDSDDEEESDEYDFEAEGASAGGLRDKWTTSGAAANKRKQAESNLIPTGDQFELLAGGLLGAGGEPDAKRRKTQHFAGDSDDATENSEQESSHAAEDVIGRLGGSNQSGSGGPAAGARPTTNYGAFSAGGGANKSGTTTSFSSVPGRNATTGNKAAPGAAAAAHPSSGAAPPANQAAVSSNNTKTAQLKATAANAKAKAKQKKTKKKGKGAKAKKQKVPKPNSQAARNAKLIAKIEDTDDDEESSSSSSDGEDGPGDRDGAAEDDLFLHLGLGDAESVFADVEDSIGDAAGAGGVKKDTKLFEAKHHYPPGSVAAILAEAAKDNQHVSKKKQDKKLSRLEPTNQKHPLEPEGVDLVVDAQRNLQDRNGKLAAAAASSAQTPQTPRPHTLLLLAKKHHTHKYDPEGDFGKWIECRKDFFDDKKLLVIIQHWYDHILDKKVRGKNTVEARGVALLEYLSNHNLLSWYLERAKELWEEETKHRKKKSQIDFPLWDSLDVGRELQEFVITKNIGCHSMDGVVGGDVLRGMGVTTKEWKAIKVKKGEEREASSKIWCQEEWKEKWIAKKRLEQEEKWKKSLDEGKMTAEGQMTWDLSGGSSGAVWDANLGAWTTNFGDVPGDVVASSSSGAGVVAEAAGSASGIAAGAAKPVASSSSSSSAAPAAQKAAASGGTNKQEPLPGTRKQRQAAAKKAAAKAKAAAAKAKAGAGKKKNKKNKNAAGGGGNPNGNAAGASNGANNQAGTNANAASRGGAGAGASSANGIFDMFNQYPGYHF